MRITSANPGEAFPTTSIRILRSAKRRQGLRPMCTWVPSLTLLRSAGKRSAHEVVGRRVCRQLNAIQ